MINLKWDSNFRWQDVCMVGHNYSESSVALRYFISLLHGMSDEHCAGTAAIGWKTRCKCQGPP
jgi:hypothetical protein